MTPLVFEFLVLTLLLGSGIAMARLLGVSSLAAIPAGLLLATSWRALSYSALEIAGLAQIAREVWLVSSALVLLVALVRYLKDRSFWLLLALGSLVSLIGPLVTRGLGIRGIPHSDSLWILTLSDLMQRAGDLEIVGGRTAIKRGFSYPMLLALGPQGESLTGLTPVIFLVLVIAMIWAVRSLAPKLPVKTWLTILLPLGLVLATAPIILRSFTYVNGHTLTAVGVLVAAVAVVRAVAQKSLSKENLVLVMSGLAVISMTRPEGVAFAAVIAAPLLAQRFLTRWQIRLVVASALMSFGLWMYVYDSYIPNLFRLYDERFPVAMLIGTFLVGLKIFDWLRFRLVALAYLGMGGLFGFVLVTNFAELIDDLGLQFQNAFLGAGFWGTFFVALVPTLVVIGRKNLSVEYLQLVNISVMLVLGSLTAKLLDGGLFGDPTLGRLGWTDSLNRMWLHGFGIFVVSAVVGLAQRAIQSQQIRIRQ